MIERYYGFCEVQNRGHSGTLRAMSESVPANNSKLLSDQPAPQAVTAGEPVVVPVPDDGAKQQSDGLGVREIGGPQGPEPTRYGDWERKGRCIDF